jgi:hypothetical protein
LKRQYDREQIGGTVDFPRISSNKHYQNSSQSGIIIREKYKKGVYPVSQKQIDDIISGDLAGIKFSARPTYSSRITTPGMTTFELYSWGEVKGIKALKIGKQFSNDPRELFDTLLHEELEARIQLKRTKKHISLSKAGTDAVIHPYIDKVIARYNRMKGR